MTGNTFRDALESDTLQLGAGVVSCSPTIVEAVGRMGLDFVWLDLEHSGISPTDSDRLENLARAADVSETELVVRVTSPAPHVVRKVLDASIRNVVIPRVETADEVAQAVEASRFVHEGEPGDRGAGLGRANYWGEDVSADYRRREDDTALVGVNIENHRAVTNLDEILAVTDLGFVLLGHQDLSVSMGTTPDDDAVQSAIETYRETADANDVPFGRSVGTDVDAIGTAVDQGYNMLLIGNEIGAARAVFGDRVDRFSETT